MAKVTHMIWSEVQYHPLWSVWYWHDMSWFNSSRFLATRHCGALFWKREEGEAEIWFSWGRSWGRALWHFAFFCVEISIDDHRYSKIRTRAERLRGDICLSSILQLLICNLHTSNLASNFSVEPVLSLHIKEREPERSYSHGDIGSGW